MNEPNKSMARNQERLTVRRLVGPEADLLNPSGLYYDEPEQQLWICDMRNSRLVQYSMLTGFLKAVPSNCDNDRTLVVPLAVTRDSEQQIVITDVHHNAIFRFKDQWKELIISDPDLLKFPSSIVCDKQGNFYVISFYDNQVIRIDHDGNATALENIVCRGPYGLSIFNDDLYIADTGNRRFQRLHIPTSELTVLLEGFAAPIAVTFDKNGDMYFSENRRLFRLKRGADEPDLLLDKEIWKFYNFGRLGHIGALACLGKNSLALTDTVQNCVYEIIMG